MKKIFLISIIILSVSIILSCGTEPTPNSGNVQLQTVENHPYVFIRPPEEPEGTPTETITNVNEHAGRVYSYTRRIAYDNMIIIRDISDIEYYSYYWLNGKIRAYRETRTFEPFGESTNIVVDYCLYSNGYLDNYRARVDGMVYFFGHEYDPDTLNLSAPPSPS